MHQWWSGHEETAEPSHRIIHGEPLLPVCDGRHRCEVAPAVRLLFARKAVPRVARNGLGLRGRVHQGESVAGKAVPLAVGGSPSGIRHLSRQHGRDRGATRTQMSVCPLASQCFLSCESGAQSLSIMAVSSTNSACTPGRRVKYSPAATVSRLQEHKHDTSGCRLSAVQQCFLM